MTVDKLLVITGLFCLLIVVMSCAIELVGAM